MVRRAAAFAGVAACAPPPARAPRQSLPTTRERRWLAERRIGRQDARPVYSSFQQSFQLRVWNLALVSPPCERPRGARPPVRGAEAAADWEEAEAEAEAEAEVETEVETELGTETEKKAHCIAIDVEARVEPSDVPTEGRACIAEKQLPPMVSGHLSRRRTRWRDPAAADAPTRDGAATGRRSHDQRQDVPLMSTLTREEFAAVMTWAYVVHLRVAKTALGKRAVVRSRAKRRVAAAVRAVFPQHACRGREYSFFILPAALVTPLPDLLAEARDALVETCSFREQLSEAELRRPWYRRPR